MNCSCVHSEGLDAMTMRLYMWSSILEFTSCSAATVAPRRFPCRATGSVHQPDARAGHGLRDLREGPVPARPVPVPHRIDQTQDVPSQLDLIPLREVTGRHPLREQPAPVPLDDAHHLARA